MFIFALIIIVALVAVLGFFRIGEPIAGPTEFNALSVPEDAVDGDVIVNPANGLPMQDDAIDIEGNPFGIDGNLD